jgi:phospholipid/cholesterol/gamma-HCH transport system permease protein
MKFLKHIFEPVGSYGILMWRVLSKPEHPRKFYHTVIHEINALGLSSLGIITIISLFMGAVITIQSASNIDTPFIPKYTIGFVSRQTVLLELSPTIIALILAGKIGSNIASELGTMRVTEQIDALEIMGINSANFLILPKITAAILINPFLIIISMFQAMFGSYLAAVFTGAVSHADMIYGLTYEFKPFSITYAIIKTLVFAFIITSIPSYYGYYAKGGSLEVGKSSTKSVVQSSVMILIFNYILTQLLLL